MVREKEKQEMICEHCFREYKAVHELEEFKLKDEKTNEKVSVFECPICCWILPTPQEIKV